MKEYPILFSGEMVKAILEGRKTQTRRIIKFDENRRFRYKHNRFTYFLDIESLLRTKDACPYGTPGDRLWVRETWCKYHTLDGNENEIPGTGRYYYAANDWPKFDYYIDETTGKHREFPKWRPSIHMPREASRINLVIDKISIERLQDITEKDARAEGIKGWTKDGEFYKYGITEPGEPGAIEWREMPLSSIDAFKNLWDQINSSRANWESNPWVWVIKFHREN